MGVREWARMRVFQMKMLGVWVLVLDGVEEREDVGEVRGRMGAEFDELALGEEGVDDEGVDLFQDGDVGAFR